MSYRGMDNSNFRNQSMARPKGRPPFNKQQQHNCEPMPTVGRPRFMTPLQGMQQPQYAPSVGYARNPQYSPEYATVQYGPQIPGWSQTIPITMAETYPMPGQHPAYPQQQQQQQQQQQVYATEPAHMIAMPNSAFIAQVQNQNDFDPFANVVNCPKCNFTNNLALLKLKMLAEENKKLHEQLSSMEQQLAANASYEDPSYHPQPVQQVSSLSVDAQPFQMGAAQEAKPQPQGTNSAAPADNHPAEPPANRLPSHNNNNGDGCRPGRDWSTSRDAVTPVVSASDVGSATEADWNEVPAEQRLADDGEISDGQPAAAEPPSVSANWDANETVVPTTSGPFVATADSASLPPRDSDEHRNHRPRDQRQRPNSGRPRGGRNDSHDSNRDADPSRRNFNNRRESGGSNTGFPHRNMSPQDQKDGRTEKSVSGSRDSSQGRPKPDQSDKRETESADVKRFDSGDRSPSERRVDSAERGSYGRPHDSGDSRYGVRRGGSKGWGSDNSNWRHPDVGSDNRRDNRGGGNRGGGGYGRRLGTGGGGSNSKAVVEKDGDLFTSPPDYSLAHCVAEDFRMGSGIAVNFRQLFKQVDELLDQRKRVGQVAVLEDKGRFVYYLVTKRRSSGKPAWGDFVAAVEELSKLCVAAGVKNLAMPRIGCGLDRLQWPEVKRLLDEVFGDTGVTVTAYNFQQNEEPESPMSKPKSTLYVMHRRNDLVEIDAETGLIFLCSEENSTTNRTIDSLDKKHKIMYDLRSAKRTAGEVVTIQKGKEYLYGLVVRKCDRDALSYSDLGKCLRKIRSTNNKDRYGYFGVEAFRDDRDPLTMEKFMTVVRNTFSKVPYKLEFYVCWPEEYQNDHLWDEQGPK